MAAKKVSEQTGGQLRNKTLSLFSLVSLFIMDQIYDFSLGNGAPKCY